MRWRGLGFYAQGQGGRVALLAQRQPQSDELKWQQGDEVLRTHIQRSLWNILGTSSKHMLEKLSFQCCLNPFLLVFVLVRSFELV